MKGDTLVREYEYFTSWGLSPNQIAEKLGIQPDSLIRTLLRNGITPVRREDWQAVLVLERLIASGEVFTMDHLPNRSGEVHKLVLRAISNGRVRRVGTRPGLNGEGPVSTYQSKEIER